MSDNKNTLHLLLIGGGEIETPKLETLAIDEFFINSIAKKEPTILFIPTASEFYDKEKTYEQNIRFLYEKKLGCHITTLYLTPAPAMEEIKEKLENADAVYIGGGDPLYMLKKWHEAGLDTLLKNVALSGKPIAGISAGAMCWFEKVLMKGETESFFVRGFDLFKNFCLPHWNKHRYFADLELAKDFPFLAIEDNAAVFITNNKIKLIKAADTATACYCQVTDKLYTQDLSTLSPADFIKE